MFFYKFYELEIYLGVHGGKNELKFSYWPYFGSKHGLMLAKLWIFIKQIIFQNFSKFSKFSELAPSPYFYNNSEKNFEQSF